MGDSFILQLLVALALYPLLLVSFKRFTEKILKLKKNVCVM